MKKLFTIAILTLTALTAGTRWCGASQVQAKGLSLQATPLQGSAQPLRLWYDRPADIFEEALPLGNGKLGALVYGGTDDNVVYLNDITLWAGKPVNLNDGTGLSVWIPKIREALFNEDYQLADSLQRYVQGHFCNPYQPLGFLHIRDLNQGEVTGYRRTLDLDSAVCSDRYQRGGVSYTRSYFVSHPDKVIAIRLAASAKGALNCELSLGSLLDKDVKVSDKQITMVGHAMGDPRETTHFCTVLRLLNDGGQVSTTDSSLVIRGADQATLYIVNETSFNGARRHPVQEGAPYLENAMDDAWHLVNFTYDSLYTRHEADYQKIFHRVSFLLEDAQFNHAIPTDSMLHAYGQDPALDRYLETLYFQYGRYLLISSSRTQGAPANLQGLWNILKFAPWNSNYTININLEENYWPCDVANMPEMFDPLSSYVQELAVTGHAVAKNFYGIDRGWSVGHNSDIWAMANPVGEQHDLPMWANWNMGGAWLCQNLYDHYLYTQDRDYLAKTAYPLMRGASEFMLRWLIPNPKNPEELITAPSTSPENEYKTDKGYHGMTCYGGTADLAIIRELFANTIEAAGVLGIDKAYCDTIARALARLHPYTVGHQGDLNEWYYDWDDWDPQHRHQSHLIGLYPGHQFDINDEDDTLVKAATRTLEQKGDISTGWSTGWRINLWARLHRADKAYLLYHNLLSYVNPKHPKSMHGGTYPNLFDAHPPFQIDGNFGGTAGVCEMLMQSHNGVIELLPALPECWRSGEINGLIARGGYALDFCWQDGKVKTLKVTGKKKGSFTLLVNGQTMKVKIRKDGASVVKKFK